MDKLSKYKVNYFSKYYFYEEEDFLENIEDGNYILNQIKENNRFDYKDIHLNILNLEIYQ